MKYVPVGLFVLYSFAFDNAQIGRETRDFTVPCLLIPVFFALFVLIHLYYQKTFGRVESTAQFRGKEILITLGALVVAWAAFVLDSLGWIPVSFFAVYLALIMFLGQVGMVRQAGGKNPAIFPAGLVCIALAFLTAFLPILGEKVTGLFGFQSGISLAGAAVGILYAVYGVLEHFFLVRSMAPAVESDHGESV